MSVWQLHLGQPGPSLLFKSVSLSRGRRALLDFEWNPEPSLLSRSGTHLAGSSPGTECLRLLESSSVSSNTFSTYRSHLLRIYSSVPYGLSFTTVNGIIRTTLWPLDFSGSNSHRTRDLGFLSDQMFAGGCAKAPGELLCNTGNSKWVTMRQVQLPIHDPWGHT